MNRRQALLRFGQFMAASPLLHADKKYSELTELLKQVNVFDFAKLAKAKLDPLAWDYLDEGSDDEVSLRDSRSAFEHLIIRPHFLLHDVASIDTSVSLFGHTMPQPFYLSVTGGKNCFLPNGEQETAMASGTANAMMITNGGISDLLASGKGPKMWWQFTTAAEFRNKNQMAEFANRLEDEGLVEGRWVEESGKRRRRYYTLTRDGRKRLASERSVWQNFFLARGKPSDRMREGYGGMDGHAHGYSPNPVVAGADVAVSAGIKLSPQPTSPAPD